jgi:hypothetical protein
LKTQNALEGPFKAQFQIFFSFEGGRKGVEEGISNEKKI